MSSTKELVFGVVAMSLGAAQHKCFDFEFE